MFLLVRMMLKTLKPALKSCPVNAPLCKYVHKDSFSPPVFQCTVPCTVSSLPAPPIISMMSISLLYGHLDIAVLLPKAHSAGHFDLEAGRPGCLPAQGKIKLPFGFDSRGGVVAIALRLTFCSDH